MWTLSEWKQFNRKPPIILVPVEEGNGNERACTFHVGRITSARQRREEEGLGISDHQEPRHRKPKCEWSFFFLLRCYILIMMIRFISHSNDVHFDPHLPSLASRDPDLLSHLCSFVVTHQEKGEYSRLRGPQHLRKGIRHHDAHRCCNWALLRDQQVPSE